MAACIRLRRTYAPPLLLRDLLAANTQVGRPAGYAGEGHHGWTSTVILSDSDKAARAEIDLSTTPYFREVLASLGCTVHLARLMALEPGGVIQPHRDAFIGEGLARLHVPIVTHREVEFMLDGARCWWNEGELWYGDFSTEHSAVNHGLITRVHMVFDVFTDRDFAALFPPDAPYVAPPAPAIDKPPVSAAELRRFEFRFVLPAGFALPGAGYVNSRTDGAVVALRDRLHVFVDGQPLLRAMPISSDTLALLGLPSAAALVCDFVGDRVICAALPVLRFHLR